VVKNVSGYDMGKLYTGSLGTLGLIVEASFKLTPLPPLQSTILAWFGELGDAFEAARTIFKTALPIRACELLSPTAAEDLGWPGGHLLAVWIGGGRAAVERQNRDVGGLCGAASRVEMLAADQIAPFWRAVEDFGRGEHLAIAKLSVLPSATGDLLGRLPAGSSWLSHVLSGVGYIFGSEAEGSLQTAREMGGYAILEACEPEVKRRLDVWGPPGPDFRLMERIKRQFDPNGMLNPGRYIGGL
ncbi:MAG TPA: FAD-linked oxidase C-terminal domain-containing protein, partial [Chloroflexota bacterium]